MRKKQSRTRKPKWVHLTFDDIEAKRVLLGLNVPSMAERLMITPSAYYTWKKGVAVPPSTRQLTIKKKLLEMGRPVERPVPVSTPECVGVASHIIQKYLATNGKCDLADLPRLIRGVRRALA